MAFLDCNAFEFAMKYSDFRHCIKDAETTLIKNLAVARKKTKPYSSEFKQKNCY